MPLINHEPIIHLLRGYRIAHIAGRLGGGKTSLAYRLALELCEHHHFRYIVSNCDDVVSDAIDDVRPRRDPMGQESLLDTVLILDEAGTFLESGRHARQFTAYLRKLNVVVLLPSAEAPPPRVRFLSITRKYDLSAVGIPLWWYHVRVSTGIDRYTYSFGWRGYSEIFGVFNTYDFPADDSDIGGWLGEHISGITSKRKKRARKGAFAGVNQLTVDGLGGDAAGEGSPMADSLRWVAEAFIDSAGEFADSVSLLADQKPAKTRKRRS